MFVLLLLLLLFLSYFLFSLLFSFCFIFGPITHFFSFSWGPFYKAHGMPAKPSQAALPTAHDPCPCSRSFLPMHGMDFTSIFTSPLHVKPPTYQHVCHLAMQHAQDCFGPFAKLHDHYQFSSSKPHDGTGNNNSSSSYHCNCCYNDNRCYFEQSRHEYA